MQIFEMSYNKLEHVAWNPVTRKMVTTLLAPYTLEQYAALGAKLQAALGEGFISFEVLELPASQSTETRYHGPVVGDLEQNRNDEIDAAFNQWFAEMS